MDLKNAKLTELGEVGRDWLPCQLETVPVAQKESLQLWRAGNPRQGPRLQTHTHVPRVQLFYPQNQRPGLEGCWFICFLPCHLAPMPLPTGEECTAVCPACMSP